MRAMCNSSLICGKTRYIFVDVFISNLLVMRISVLIEYRVIKSIPNCTTRIDCNASIRFIIKLLYEF